MDNTIQKITEIKQLRDNGFGEQARVEIIKLVNEYTTVAVVQVECAFIHDSLGYEHEAIPYYEKALELGIEGPLRVEAYLGLGSSLRCIGSYQKAAEIFEKAIEEFPNHRGLQIFYSMTQYNLGNHGRAMDILLTNLIETTNNQDILDYKRAISFYINNLDEVYN
ncbi:tetratricopeptide repeat protein [Bacillus luteolus]|uniref:Tetratricopeptide repeat protein n=1 Tax=Litchfieldia luteola TaxID=682179 RepID=A0ABR9QMC5_9BACI|nr:tetratricopeptide repeat protein [Cytobacillus luteolus]MBE4909556.1 tetratricopeptide repeat protein [Cytobacillus luteolus]MBP1940957.1 tetratricopeptide (TPR) repeat protein [Cytobacillus luteolus]